MSTQDVVMIAFVFILNTDRFQGMTEIMCQRELLMDILTLQEDLTLVTFITQQAILLGVYPHL
jgi:hypothetical protein